MRACPISAAAAYPLSSTLHLPFHISQGSVEQLENVLLVLQDAEGKESLGEAAPFPVLTGDTQQTALVACRQLLGELVGMTPEAALLRLYDTLWPAFGKTPTALAGVEIALWDLHAQQQGVPLAKLWGSASWEGAETDITLPCLSAAEVTTFHRHFAPYEFPFFKVKVGGGAVADDVARVMALRSCVGPGLRLSLDGNQGLTESQAETLIATLAGYDIQPLFFEQPLAAEDLRGMARLGARLPIPICADESVCSVADVQRVIELGAARMVNLKFMKSGVRESLRMAELAARSHLSLMIGGMVESEIAMTASLHAVCGTGLISVCDLDTPFFLTERFTHHSPYHGHSAKLKLPTGNGLGLTILDAVRSGNHHTL
jgi:L-alanine-DL-glutamate epimerase-like enolase superfamily enzyme